MDFQQAVGQRIKEMRGRKKISAEALSERVGVSRAAIYQFEKGTSAPKAENLVAIADTLGTDVNYLLTGRQMEQVVLQEPATHYKTQSRMPTIITVDNIGKENISYVDRRAKAGYLNGHADPEYIEQLPAFSIPKFSDRTYRAFEIEGPSMLPTLNPTDIVIGSYVEDYRTIKDVEPRIYMVVTKNDGILAKRLLNRLNDKSKGYFMARSDNKEFEQFPIYPEEIIEIWEARGKVTWKLTPPSREVEKRVDDVEINLDAMAQRVIQLEDLIRNRLT